MIRVRNLFWVAIHIVISIVVSFYAGVCNDLGTISVITLLQLIYAVIIFLTMRVSLLNFGSVFIICLMLFNYGQTWLYAINVDVTDLQGYTNIFSLFSDEIIITALRFSIVIVNISLLIFLALTQRGEHNDKNRSSALDYCQLPLAYGNWRLVYILYWCVVLFSNVQRAMRVSLLGYVSGYTFDNTFFYTINLYIIPMVIIEMKYRKRKGQRYLGALLPLIINEAIIILLVGNRGASLIRIIVIAIYYFSNNQRKKIKASYMIGLGCLALLVMMVMPFISVTRTDLLEIDFWTFIVKNNPIIIFLSEFGATLSTFCYAISAVNMGSGSNGLQMVSCLLTIVPGSGFIFPNITENLEFASRLNNVFRIKGLGGSMTGELFYNFKQFGSVVYGILWTFSYKLISSTYGKQKTLYKEILVYMAMFGMLTWIRGSLYDFINAMKTAIYFCILLFVFMSFDKRKHTNGGAY